MRRSRRLTEEDVDAHEGDGGLLSGEIGGTGNRASDGNDELAHAHADGAHEKQISSAHGLNEVEAGEGGRDVDAATYGVSDHHSRVR